MKMLNKKPFSVIFLKKKYHKPTCIKIGNIKALTLKTGSQPDFGGNFYQP
jgi:hypothetical protein